MSKIINLIGQNFGHLTVIKYCGTNNHRKSLWECKCDCGNPKTIIVQGSNLKSGNTTSCGCVQKQTFLNYVTKHNEKNTKLYGVWCSMKSRCNNPHNKSYHNYGGRGINICKDWESYINFSSWSKNNGYQEGLTIDRIDVNGDYSPENCRWVNNKTQANNTRCNKYFTYNNETLTIAQWEDKTGLPIGERLKQGMNIEKAITTQLHPNYHYIFYKNKKYTLAELSRILNINYMYLYRHYILKHENIEFIISNYNNKEILLTKSSFYDIIPIS